jgi:hypothetical protein
MVATVMASDDVPHPAAPDPLNTVVDLLDTVAPRCGQVTVLAVDGGAASGKSTLAAALAMRLTSSFVVHTDDLLDGWDDQYGYAPRLREQVLLPLARGVPGRHQRYDWSTGRFSGWVDVPLTDVLVVEGVYSAAACLPWLSIAVVLDVARAERERRWQARDGELGADARRWLDREDAHPLDVSGVPVVHLDLTALRRDR